MLVNKSDQIIIGPYFVLEYVVSGDKVNVISIVTQRANDDALKVERVAEELDDMWTVPMRYKIQHDSLHIELKIPKTKINLLDNLGLLIWRENIRIPHSIEESKA